MSTKLPTLDDLIDPDQNIPINKEEPKNKDSLKKETTEKSNEKEGSGKKIKKTRTKKKDKKDHKAEEHKTEDKKVEDKKVEDKKVEDKKEEPKEEPKKEEIKKEEIKKEEQKEEPKKEEIKKEEPKEEPKKEEIKQEEKKEEKKEDKKEEEKKDEKKEEAKEEPKKVEPKVEEDLKEEKKEDKNFPPKPKEPEPKIPTDFSELIEEINEMKQAGNELYKQKAFEEAISKYKEAHDKLEKELPKIDKERDYNPQSAELFTLFIQLSQNLSLCYFKTENYEESIKLDRQIISRDNNYDKAYFRLFKSHMKLGKKAEAVYFGNHLLGFDEETKKRYEETIPEIEEEKKALQAEYDAIRAKERKENLKTIAKYAIPIVILVGAFLVYFFMFRKKKVAAK